METEFPIRDEQGEYAVLSKAAYDLYYGNIAEANEELAAYGLPYKIDEEHTSATISFIIRTMLIVVELIMHYKLCELIVITISYLISWAQSS